MKYHNINLVKGLYHNILHCQFNESFLSKLNEIIKNRHDIVHRNGKTVSNEIISISNDDLNNAFECIFNFIKDIDSQIINHLLDE